MADKFDQLILTKTPHFIAINYKQVLETENPKEKIQAALHVYDLALRALAIGLVSQYLIRDRKQVRDSHLNQLLIKELPRASLDVWQRLFFATLQAYEGKRDLFFMTEL